jgi:protein SCO1
MRRLLAMTLAVAAAGEALADTKLPTELEGVDIEDRFGATLPQELRFLDHRGGEVRLGDYLDGKQPLLLVLAYYQCPTLCSIVLNGVTDGIRELPFIPGEGYRVVTVSIDPRDTIELAAAKRETYLDAYRKPVSGKPGARPWDFLIQRPGDAASIAALTEAVGFRYRWDAKTQQFAHAAGAFLFTPDGRLSRTLYGIQFPSRDLRLAVVEASEGKLGSAWDKLLLFCYHYAPGQGYTVSVMRLLRLGAALTVLILATFLIRLWRKDRARGQVEHHTA